MYVIQTHPECPPFAVPGAVGRPHLLYTAKGVLFLPFRLSFPEPLVQRVVLLYKKGTCISQVPFPFSSSPVRPVLRFAQSGERESSLFIFRSSPAARAADFYAGCLISGRDCGIVKKSTLSFRLREKTGGAAGTKPIKARNGRTRKRARTTFRFERVGRAPIGCGTGSGPSRRFKGLPL